MDSLKQTAVVGQVERNQALGMEEEPESTVKKRAGQLSSSLIRQQFGGQPSSAPVQMVSASKFGSPATAGESSGHTSLPTGPDVCHSPNGPSPIPHVPIPYPNAASVSRDKTGTGTKASAGTKPARASVSTFPAGNMARPMILREALALRRTAKWAISSTRGPSQLLMFQLHGHHNHLVTVRRVLLSEHRSAPTSGDATKGGAGDQTENGEALARVTEAIKLMQLALQQAAKPEHWSPQVLASLLLRAHAATISALQKLDD